ncbi:MAG: hypothetical protein IAG13_18980, partial [Deltaproteobacteria bacterium]|nr:hypothetical protein [Nannocystaceae bacterium]
IALRVVARGRARARILDGGEQPVAGAYVWIRSKSGGLHSSGDRSRTESGSNGVIELPGPAGAVELTVLAPAGFETRIVTATLVSGELAELGDIVLEARD